MKVIFSLNLCVLAPNVKREYFKLCAHQGNKVARAEWMMDLLKHSAALVIGSIFARKAQYTE